MNPKNTLSITPAEEDYPCNRQGLIKGICADEISGKLGFAPNSNRKQYAWRFLSNGEKCGIWEYMGSAKLNRFSCFGPDEVFEEIFGDHYSNGRNLFKFTEHLGPFILTFRREAQTTLEDFWLEMDRKKTVLLIHDKDSNCEIFHIDDLEWVTTSFGPKITRRWKQSDWDALKEAIFNA